MVIFKEKSRNLIKMLNIHVNEKYLNSYQVEYAEIFFKIKVKNEIKCIC